MNIRSKKEPLALREKKAELLIAQMIEQVKKNGGTLPIYTNGAPVSTYRAMRRYFPECFRGPSSPRWLWKLMEDEGLLITQEGLPKGKLTAKLMPEKETVG